MPCYSMKVSMSLVASYRKTKINSLGSGFWLIFLFFVFGYVFIFISACFCRITMDELLFDLIFDSLLLSFSNMLFDVFVFC